MVDKSRQDADVMQQIVRVSQLKFNRKGCYPFENALLFPYPTQYNVEIQVKLQELVFIIVCQVGERLSRWSALACVQKWQKCKSVQDFCPWSKQLHNIGIWKDPALVSITSYMKAQFAYKIQNHLLTRALWKIPNITSVDRGCPFLPAPKEENLFLQNKITKGKNPDTTTSTVLVTRT